MASLVRFAVLLTGVLVFAYRGEQDEIPPNQLRVAGSGKDEKPTTFAMNVHFAVVSANWVLVAAVLAGLYYVFVRLLRMTSYSSAVALPTQPTSFSMMFGLGQFALVWYCFFSVSHTFFQHMAAGVRLDPIVPTILVYLLKLVLALIMYRCADGTFGDLALSLRNNKSAVLWYLLPAGCLAFYDLLSFLSLAHLSPAQYQILLHLRTVLIAFVWQIVMSKRLTATQWLLLCSCIYAAVLTERNALMALMDTSSIATNLLPYATLGIQYALSITGNLSNEKFLKQVDLSVNAQNVVLYILGTVLLTGTLAVRCYLQGKEFLTVEQLPLILEPSILMSILTIGLMGISTGFVLKLMGNIWRELAAMVVTFTVAAIDWFVLKSRKVDLIDCQAVAIVALSLGVYALLEKKMDEETKKGTVRRLI